MIVTTSLSLGGRRYRRHAGGLGPDSALGLRVGVAAAGGVRAVSTPAVHRAGEVEPVRLLTRPG